MTPLDLGESFELNFRLVDAEDLTGYDGLGNDDLRAVHRSIALLH